MMRNYPACKELKSACTYTSVQELLTLNMLSPDISCLENSVDPDHLASEKPADQDPHYFPLCKYIG